MWSAGDPNPKTCVGLHGLSSTEQYTRLNHAAQKVADETGSVKKGLYPVVAQESLNGPVFSQMTVGTHLYPEVPRHTINAIWRYACSTETLPYDKPLEERPLVAANASDPISDAIERSAKDVTGRDLQVTIDPSNTGGAPVIAFYENGQPARINVAERYQILNAAATGNDWDRTTKSRVLNLQAKDANGSKPPTDDGDAK